ncbi:MAG: ABC transporter permease [Myxococcales bacterium FL481]|nr:MAG: ABC transporter permease [Myxococcales bacterium FL481]
MGDAFSPTWRPWRFAIRRVLAGALVLVVVFVTIAIVGEVLIDPAVGELGPLAEMAALDERRRQLDLDRPLRARVVDQLAAAATFEWGTSIVHRRPVTDVLWSGLGPTLAYAVPGFCLATVAGAATAATQLDAPATRRAAALNLAAATLLGMSSLVLVVLVHDLFATRLGWFPALGWPLTPGSHLVGLGHLLLPILVWALLQWGADYRMYRAIFIAEARQPHYMYMAARGLPRSRIRRHLLRGCAGTVVARVVQRLPHLLVGSVVIEDVFNVPGLGDAVIVAARANDRALLQGVAVLSAAATVVVQTGGDVLARWLDPRLRLE